MSFSLHLPVLMFAAGLIFSEKISALTKLLTRMEEKKKKGNTPLLYKLAHMINGGERASDALYDGLH